MQNLTLCANWHEAQSLASQSISLYVRIASAETLVVSLSEFHLICETTPTLIFHLNLPRRFESINVPPRQTYGYSVAFLSAIRVSSINRILYRIKDKGILFCVHTAIVYTEFLNSEPPSAIAQDYCE